MRPDASFLNDILAACRKIESLTVSMSQMSFTADELRPAAVLHHLTVIGEAVVRISPELKARHPEIPWKQIAATRNLIVHAYFDLDTTPAAGASSPRT